MKYVMYKDGRGYIKRSLVKDDDDESMGKLGIPSGPPDIEMMDWESIKMEINNALVKGGLFTWQDVQRSPVEFTGVINIVRRHLITLFRDQV